MNIELRNKKKEITGYTIVSPEDFEHLNQFKWYKDKDNGITGFINKKYFKMHRYIMIEILKYELTSKNNIQHINNNRLDNTRENLILVSSSENSRNKKKKINCTSNYFGVSKPKNQTLYYVNINLPDKKLSASYKNEQHAAHQYNLWLDEFNIKTSSINNIDIPHDFVKYEKAKREFPKGISKTITGEFMVKHTFNTKGVNIKHVETYSTLQQAIESNNRILYKKNQEIENNIRNTKILYNKYNQCIFKIKEMEIIIDEELYYDIIKYKWFIDKRQRINGHINNKIVLLPRFIMNYDGHLLIDHTNNNRLDNRKCNLRIVTHSQNAMNRICHKNSSSKYVGVSKINNKWTASIYFKNKNIYLGCFSSEIEAAKARDIATKNYYGEYGNLNFNENINMS
jgi:hypothetical protein